MAFYLFYNHSGKRGKLITNIRWCGAIPVRSLGKTTVSTESNCVREFFPLSLSISHFHLLVLHLLKQVRGANREIDNEEISHTNQICTCIRDNNGSYLNRTGDHYKKYCCCWIYAVTVVAATSALASAQSAQYIRVCERAAVSVKLTSTPDDDFAGFVCICDMRGYSEYSCAKALI